MAQNSRQTEIEYNDQPGMLRKLKSSGPDVQASLTNMIELTTSASDDLENAGKRFR